MEDEIQVQSKIAKANWRARKIFRLKVSFRRFQIAKKP